MAWGADRPLPAELGSSEWWVGGAGGILCQTLSALRGQCGGSGQSGDVAGQWSVPPQSEGEAGPFSTSDRLIDALRTGLQSELPSGR